MTNSHGVCKRIILIEAQSPAVLPMHVTLSIPSTDSCELCSQYNWFKWSGGETCAPVFMVNGECTFLMCIVCFLTGYINVCSAECVIVCKR